MIYSHHIIPDCEFMKIIYVHCCLEINMKAIFTVINPI